MTKKKPDLFPYLLAAFGGITIYLYVTDKSFRKTMNEVIIEELKKHAKKED